VLLLIVVAFVVVGVLSARRVSSRLTVGVDAASRVRAATGRALRLQMLGTTAFVFVTFLLRSVFSTMLAVALQLRDLDKNCPGVTICCDASCYNVYTHIAGVDVLHARVPADDCADIVAALLCSLRCGA